MSGGGPSSTTTSGIQDKAYEQYVSPFLQQAQQSQQQGDLSQVAGFTPAQVAAQQAGTAAAGRQEGLEQSLVTQANQGMDLSGAKTAATQQAQMALGGLANAAGRTGNLGGSRQMLNQEGIQQDLSAKFAGLDQQAQQQNFARTQAALGSQGHSAGLLGQVGQAQQSQNQAEADAEYQGLSRLGGMFGVLPQSSTTTQTGGK